MDKNNSINSMKKWNSSNKFQVIHILPEIDDGTVIKYLHELIRQHQFQRSEFVFNCLICQTNSSSLLNKFSNIRGHLKHSSHISNIKRACKPFTAICISCRYISIADDPNSIFKHFMLHEAGTAKIDRQVVEKPFDNDRTNHSSSSSSSAILDKNNINAHNDSTNRKFESLNEKECLDIIKDTSSEHCGTSNSLLKSLGDIHISPDNVSKYTLLDSGKNIIHEVNEKLLTENVDHPYSLHKGQNTEPVNIDNNNETIRQFKDLSCVESSNNTRVVTTVDRNCVYSSSTGVPLAENNSTNLVSDKINIVSDKCFYPKEAIFSNLTLQLISPGVSEDEFTISQGLNDVNIRQYCTETYYSEYYPLQKLYFSCLECKSFKLRENEFYKHLTQEKHYNKSVDNCSNYFIKICDICQVLLLGRLEIIKEHFQSTPHKLNRKRKLGAITEQYEVKSGELKLGFSGLLTDKCTFFFSSKEILDSWIESSLKETKEVLSSAGSLKKVLERDFNKALKEKYSDFHLEVFGSRLYELANFQSDVDIYLNIGEVSVCDLEEYFQRAGDLFEVKRIISDAKVPLIRLKHLESNLICDVSTIHPSALYCSQLIKLYVNLDERVRWLLIAVIKWSEENDIRSYRKFKSYAIICIVLFFLMLPHICLIPSVEKLKSLHRGTRLYLNGWDYSFCRDVDKIKNKHNPLLCNLNKYELLAEFFKYYSTLDTKKSILFLHNGRVYSRSKFFNPNLPIPGFKKNQKCHQLNFYGDHFIIMDFFNLADNISKMMDENLLDHFKSICHKTLLCGWRN